MTTLVGNVLDGWKPEQPVPTELIPILPQAIAEYRATIEPADKKSWLVVMDRFTNWIERFGVVPVPTTEIERKRWRQDLIFDYRDALADLPADLLEEAIRQVMATARYRVLPMPGDIRAIVADELRKRQDQLNRLTTAQILSKRAPEPQFRTVPTKEDRAAAVAACARIKTMLAEAGTPLSGPLVKKIGGTDDDRREASRDPYRDAYRALNIAPEA